MQDKDQKNRTKGQVPLEVLSHLEVMGSARHSALVEECGKSAKAAIRLLKQQGALRETNGIYEPTALGDCLVLGSIKITRSNFDRAFRFPDGRVRLYDPGKGPTAIEMAHAVPLPASATVFSLAKAHLQKSLGEEFIFSQGNKWTG